MASFVGAARTGALAIGAWLVAASVTVAQNDTPDALREAERSVVRVVTVSLDATGQPIGHALAAGGLNVPSFGRDYALLSGPGGTAIVTLNLKAWQAAAWPPWSASAGISRLHGSNAQGQRGWNAHPEGGAIGFGISPSIGRRGRPLISRSGRASISRRV